MFLKFGARSNNSKRPLCALLLTYVMVALSGCDGDSHDDDGYDDYEVRAEEDAFPYRKNSPYASILKECVLIGTVAESCNVDQMPFIGDGATTPSVDDVMDRVLVTNKWMGQRFEDALRNAADNTLLTLFSSITSVLIGSDVRPSFYIATTAGIQIDANYLWVTEQEKSSVSVREDERADYGKDLQFQFIARTADTTGERLTPYFSLEQSAERTVEQMQLPLYRLLYHELTHANDFMPRHKIPDVNPDISLYDAISEIRSEWLSASFISQYPKTSSVLELLAEVRFGGQQATEEQMSMTASDVGEQMHADGAMQFYSYYSEHEDLAQLMESALMAYHFDARINVGFVQKPEATPAPCSEYLVSWGQRNRLGESLVNLRSRAAAALLLNDTQAIEAYLDNELGLSEPMSSGVDWCQNQAFSLAVSNPIQLRNAARPIIDDPAATMNAERFQDMLEFESTHHLYDLH